MCLSQGAHPCLVRMKTICTYYPPMHLRSCTGFLTASLPPFTGLEVQSCKKRKRVHFFSRALRTTTLSVPLAARADEKPILGRTRNCKALKAPQNTP